MNKFLFFFAMIITQCSFAQEIKTCSEMRKVMLGQDLSAHIYWDTVPQSHLYAVSPLNRIEGEITIVNGKLYSSQVIEGKVVMDSVWKVYSPFAVYAYVEEWTVFTLFKEIHSEEELQWAVEEIAEKQGYDLNEPLVFRVEGHFDSVGFHIISKPKKEIEHNHELHAKAKKHFSLTQIDGTILGFYSKHHEGVFTHRGQFIHTHFINTTHTAMGHVEGMYLSGPVKVYLPKRKVAKQ